MKIFNFFKTTPDSLKEVNFIDIEIIRVYFIFKMVVFILYGRGKE